MGYWIRKDDDSEHIHNKAEMKEYITSYEDCDEVVPIEKWLNDNYSASDVFDMIKDVNDEMEVYKLIDVIWERYYKEVWYDNIDNPVKGKDFDYNGYLFIWVDEEDE